MVPKLLAVRHDWKTGGIRASSGQTITGFDMSLKKQDPEQLKAADLKDKGGFRVQLTDDDVSDIENAIRALSHFENVLVDTNRHNKEKRIELWLRMIRPHMETLRQRSRNVSEKFLEEQKARAALSRNIAEAFEGEREVRATWKKRNCSTLS